MNAIQRSFISQVFQAVVYHMSRYIHIVRTIARYFNAVKKIKPDWDTPDQSIISKGMGVTALLKVLNLLFPIIFEKELKNDWDKIDTLQIDDYVRFLQGLEKVDFGTNGPYGKTGSAGSIVKIKDDILGKLSYLEPFTTVKEFEEALKKTYLLRFNEILRKATTPLGQNMFKNVMKNK